MTDKMAACRSIRNFTKTICFFIGVALVGQPVQCGKAASSVETVHIIFMNHLDVGYNGISPTVGFINNVLNIYFQLYFPRAVQLSQQLRHDQYEETFIYTTHPWLVSLYLDCPNLILNNITLACPSTKDVAAFRDAVMRGDITWHAGPMNMQPENMNQALFELSLNISLDVDAEFGIKRKYATLSQRDVPGMTAAVLPSLTKFNIVAVSVGVNPGTSPPAVPNPFIWKFTDAQVIGMWNKGGYPLNPGPNPANPQGMSKENCVIVDGFTDVLCFAFRSDNSGPPQSINEILSNYEVLRGEFPGAKLMASTFDNFIEALQPIKGQLPVVEVEVGDTWVQGISSDPVKMARYWAFANKLQVCVRKGECSGDDPRIKAAVRYLIKPPEHTWGLPSVGDTVNWTNTAFNLAKNGKNYKNCENAWLEQRQFIDLAFFSLQDHPLAVEVKREWEEQNPSRPDLTGYKPVVNMTQVFTCTDGIKLQFREDGSLVELYDPYNRVRWASAENPMGEMQYVTYNETDFDYMASMYNYRGGAGYDKPNSTKNASPDSRQWSFFMESLYERMYDQSCDLLMKLRTADPAMYQKYGAPREIWLHHVTHGSDEQHLQGGIDVTVQWFEKAPTRLAESLSYSFSPTPQPRLEWYISKIGRLVAADSVVLNGSQYVHATDRGVYYTANAESGLGLLSSDVPLVYVGTKHHPPSPFPVPLRPITQQDITGTAFNFYNNIWNTNYILWYPYQAGDEHFKGRFQIVFIVDK
ncbi:uncharacterized protein LOC124124794 isoform X2 [Haliotis rufescens]|uniref:uncharacterized protein LOC124124794 isoform X2 n=1 Tax=Haliotis rufescens TaxID=6454 RepID=UPI00201F2F2E|nr:uncharacterized protein LOC124124794 isoform X2 [Haliotis rufescens]